jgi:hypothetical protein
MSEIIGLQKWYNRQCSNDWEHQYGVSISTLDNPGWLLKIDLIHTNLEDIDFIEHKIDRSDRDWILARRNGSTFEAFGGGGNLKEMIEIFLNWDAQVNQGRL